MKTEFKSILDIDDGAIIAKLDKVIMEVMKGFNDPNCDPKGKGKVTLTLTMSDDENGIIGIEDSIKHVPVSLRKNKVYMTKGTITNPITGEPSMVLREMNGQAMGQLDFSGNINEPVEVIVGLGRIGQEEIEKVQEEK